MKDGSKRTPIIQKRWTRQYRSSTASQLEGFVPIEDTYTDADGLKWVDSYGCSYQDEELVAFDASGKECILLTIG